ncbi:hypothetical protein ACOSP7_021222 [Xanthoceras sorbifolium]
MVLSKHLVQFDKFKHALFQLGFTSSKAEHSLFFKLSPHYCLYILIYVDNIIITGSNDTIISQLVTQLHQFFTLKNLSCLHYFLRIEVQFTALGLHLSQLKFVQDLLHRVHITSAHHFPSSIVTSAGHQLSTFRGSLVVDATEYRSIVGTLQYVTITHPDIAYSVNRVCQFMQNPLDEHWKL